MQEELNDVKDRLAHTERQLQLQSSKATAGRLGEGNELHNLKVQLHCKLIELV